ncbi:hypothetical protein NQZ68_028268 [Dissostichus eleginoides]|nr:hypothetical protein NQZ68_028268 [Dissostichus eleginoides]
MHRRVCPAVSQRQQYSHTSRTSRATSSVYLQLRLMLCVENTPTVNQLRQGECVYCGVFGQRWLRRDGGKRRTNARLGSIASEAEKRMPRSVIAVNTQPRLSTDMFRS